MPAACPHLRCTACRGAGMSRQARPLVRLCQHGGLSELALDEGPQPRPLGI